MARKKQTTPKKTTPKKQEKPKSKKVITTHPLRLESKETIKAKYEKGPGATRSYGWEQGSKQRTVKVKDPYTTPILGRRGVSTAVARAHEASIRGKKKK